MTDNERKILQQAYDLIGSLLEDKAIRLVPAKDYPEDGGYSDSCATPPGQVESITIERDQIIRSAGLGRARNAKDLKGDV